MFLLDGREAHTNSAVLVPFKGTFGHNPSDYMLSDHHEKSTLSLTQSLTWQDLRLLLPPASQGGKELLVLLMRIPLPLKSKQLQ